MSFEEIKFTHIPGNNKSHKVKLYALSTCGFCKRALAFLRENSIDFRFVFVDYLEKKVVGDLREELKEKSERRHILYPFLIEDDEKFSLALMMRNTRHFSTLNKPIPKNIKNWFSKTSFFSKHILPKIVLKTHRH